MPAEWEPHESTWLTWPTNQTTWPGKLLKEVESIYIQMIAALLPGERVNLLVRDKKSAARILAGIQKISRAIPTKNLIFHFVKTVDTWIRDYGPIFVRRVTCRVARPFIKFQFNAWGGKYADLARDNGVVHRITALKECERIDVPIVLEGGSIDLNGRGTCLTTEQCLLNPNRNPDLSRRRLENYLLRYLGARKVIWLKEGIEGDDTNGHVDDITRFVAPRKILTAVENDPHDKNRAILKENLDILRSSTDQDDRHFEIIELPMPGRVGAGRSDSPGDRLPASYANFYIGNRIVLLPLYSHRNDRTAVKVLQKLFPRRKVVPIECTALVYGLGSIHCVTQQEPS